MGLQGMAIYPGLAAASRDGGPAAAQQASVEQESALQASAFQEAAESCLCDARGRLEEALRSIRGRSSVEEARAEATRSTALAGQVLAKAKLLVPGSGGDLERAHERLQEYAERVGAARTPAEVASEFEAMFVSPRASLRAPVTADIDIDVDDDDGCDYSGGEIIATVLGFILGILPGIILLILLC